ncbi:MAG: hypothetical protein PHG14_05410 [Desulfobacter postgatei]|uniref:hypothetical protein n=1 Tax=Desulfobacter postgatei TaxID=2293 RepID=UPI0023F48296|nr:hypothetical protein [Desulfobacter postgatei]MDD4273149.1 hypothetical protein [Desulfobacter postgatei]
MKSSLLLSCIKNKNPGTGWVDKDYDKGMVLNGAASRQYLQSPMLEKFWQEHQSGLRNRSTELWIITMLNLWQKNFGH